MIIFDVFQLANKVLKQEKSKLARSKAIFDATAMGNFDMSNKRAQ